MNKAELIHEMAESAGVSKEVAKKVFESFQNVIATTLGKGENITLIGFGTFSVNARAAKTGRNPRTGEPMEIPAKNVVKFKPGKSLQSAVE